MRRFNPEKELYKIQHGSRNKVIFGIFLLLIILGISSSYALYQVRYSKRIIYTKVAPFSNYDIQLAVYLDGELLTSVPAKGTAYYESITCDDDELAVAGWDYTNWKLGAISAAVPNKCNLNFTTHPTTLIEQVKHVNKINNNMVIDDETTNHNLRYIGASPDNYIWFNCNDYDSLTQDTAKLKCEKWRIIGLFKDVTKVTEETEDLVKIIRDAKIADMTWDNSYPYGSNNWTRPADLQKGLNGPYLNNNDTGGWITQTEYDGRGYNTKDESYKGITSVTKNMIEQVTWNIGGMPYSSYTTAKVSDYYSAERGSSVPNGANSTWNGDIGLMYPSDYGYATGGGSSKDRSTCLAYQLFNWKESGYKEDCASNDWLLDSNISQWTLTPFSGGVAGVAGVGSDGIIGYVDYAYYTLAARPSLYLKSNVKMVSGDGSNETPYIIIP